MMVCPRCKAENAEGRIRCGKCGYNISKRGEYAQTTGPSVVVLGSVEDLRRAQQSGEIDTSNDDPDALGWLGNDEVDAPQRGAPPPSKVHEEPRSRRVSVREIDKISGLKDLKTIQAALLKAETETPAQPSRLESGGGDVAEAPPPTPPPEAAPETEPSREQGDSPDTSGPVTAYLVSELFPEPYALKPTKRYLLGRDPRASVFLPAPEVSRRHAGITSDEKGSFWVEDFRSANGTYVNGHAVLKRKLREGDRLDVGPFSLRFVKAIPGAPPPTVTFDPNEETRAIRAVPGALTGEIDKNGVVAILILLHNGKRSGVLTLRAGSQVGRIFLVEGEVHHAQFGKTMGEGALAALLPAQAGLLHFTDEKVRVTRTVGRTTAEIIASVPK